MTIVQTYTSSKSFAQTFPELCISHFLLIEFYLNWIPKLHIIQVGNK